MHDTSLILSLWKRRFNSLFYAAKTVCAGDENVFDSAVFEFVEYGQPILGALVLSYVDAQDFLVSAR